MLCRLKVPIHNIKVAPPSIPKGSPDHDLHILICTIGLDHSWLPFLRRRAKAPLVSFTPPPLYTTLITLYMHPPLLRALALMFKAPSKSFVGVLLHKKRSSLTLLILNAI
jgi:hypothetical protein